MPAGDRLPSCGFAVGSTKKGELPIKIEKRARGKKVTIVANVQGDATKLVRALQSLLGVGGTARRAEGASWAVEVQGDQTARVQKALLDFGCLQGLSKAALAELKAACSDDAARPALAVERTAATKFLAQTQGPKAPSPAEERRRLFEQEAAFYSHFWQSAVPADDFSDVWDETLADVTGEDPKARDSRSFETVEELNCMLDVLGMLPSVGSAVKQFWETSQLTLSQYRKMALRTLNFGKSGGAAKLKQQPANIIARQKVSDFRVGGARSNYFSYTCNVFDNYQKGIAPPSLEEKSMAAKERLAKKAAEPKVEVRTDEISGWCIGLLSYVAPFPLPATRLEKAESDTVSKRALARVQQSLATELSELGASVPGLVCQVDCERLAITLELYEEDFLHAPKKDAGGKLLDAQAKEELKLEKKLREIGALAKRSLEGEVLEKLQAEKVARKSEVFRDVADLKLRRVERDLLRTCKRHTKSFQDAFWEEEARLLSGECVADEPGPSQGAFDASSVEGQASVNMNDGTLEGSGPSRCWAGARLDLTLSQDEVAAFSVEVLAGHLRAGWAWSGARISELGADDASFAYDAAGGRTSGGEVEAYGEAFSAGDVLHCEAEREGGRLRIGFARNGEALGLAFDAEDGLGGDHPLVGAVCGLGAFKARLLNVERLPLHEAPGLESFREFDPPRLAVATADIEANDESCLALRRGETVHVASDDGEGWLFAFFLDPEDPDDGGWIFADLVEFLDADGDSMADDGGGVVPVADGWASPPAADGGIVADDWGDAVDDWTGVAPAANDWESPPAAAGELATDNWGNTAPAQDDWGFVPVVVASKIQSDAAASPVSCGDNPGMYEACSGYPVSSPVPECQAEIVAGLDKWLSSLSLLKYKPKAEAWCEEMGAISLDEVQECWEELAEALALKPLERKRMSRSVSS